MDSTSLSFSDLREERQFSALVCVVPHSIPSTGRDMLRISTVDTKSERRLVVEGKLVSPWVGELRKTWLAAARDLNRRKLVVDLANATVISPDGEQALLELMKDGAKFSCYGVLTKHMLKQLAARCQDHIQKVDPEETSSPAGQVGGKHCRK